MERSPEKKAELRRLLRAKRKGLDREVLSRESAAVCARLLALPELQKAQTVFCYVSCGGEVETHTLIQTLLAQGKRVAVPRCVGNGIMDCVPITALEQLEVKKMGILEPAPEAEAIAPEQVEFAIVPAVACGEDGSRLGQGGGYYDRFLEKTNCAFAAVCLEAFLLPELPCETHDRFMKIIVTQHRVLRFEGI